MSKLTSRQRTLIAVTRGAMGHGWPAARHDRGPLSAHAFALITIETPP